MSAVSEQGPGGGNSPDTRGVYVIIGALLIVVGVGLLAGVPIFGWSWGALPRLLREMREFGWPLAVILLGIGVIVYSRRPGARLPSKHERLMRSRDKKMLAGVLGGVSDYFRVDVTVLRIGYVAAALLFDLFGPLIVAYIVAAVIVPIRPEMPGTQQPQPGSSPPPGE